MDKKDMILSLLNMEDILNKYNIETKRGMFRCPIHNEKHPSAKAYGKTFKCFGCGKNGDFIQFVQYLFNLSFQEAMEKINLDFNLNIDSNCKVDFKRIKQLEKERNQKEINKKKKNEYYMQLCKKRLYLNNKIRQLRENINILNWEIQEYQISKIQMKLDILDIEIDNKFNEF